MAQSFISAISDHREVLSLDIETLAMKLLEYLAKYENDPVCNRHNFGRKNTVQGYPKEQQKEIMRVLMEAWSWLEREILIARCPAMESSMEFYFITRLGRKRLDGVQ